MLGWNPTSSRARQRSRTRLALEALETRVAAATVQPTAVEQLLLERLNDLRANPASYGLNARPMRPMALEPRITVAPRQDRPILTGTVFRDLKQNGKYDIGEGLTGVKVQVSGNLGATSVWDTGGYTLPVSTRRAATVTVTASGGLLDTTLTQTVLVRPGANSRVNFIIDSSGFRARRT